MADLIDRGSLYDKMEQRYKISSGQAHKAYGIAIDDICDAPTITPESLVRHGKWINVNYWGAEQSKATGTCSHCKRRGELRTGRNEWGFWYIDMPYCPSCGAVMDLEE